MKQQQKPGTVDPTCALRSVRSHESNSKLSNQSSYSYRRNKRQTFTRSSSTCKVPLPGCNTSKRETYKSLESLFDLNKVFHLSVDNLSIVQPPYEEKTEDSSGNCASECSFRQPKDCVKQQLKPTFQEIESRADQISDSNEETKLKFDKFEKIEDIPILSEIEEDNTSIIMMENLESPYDKKHENENESDDFECCSPCYNKEYSENSNDEKSIYAPDYPLSHEAGKEMSVKECGNSDSMASQVPVSESCVIEDMIIADDRAKVIRLEISGLKRIICELHQKCKLTEEDTVVLKNAQTSVLEKIGELNEITRKMQCTIGLVDPSDQTLTKMFQMLPYPHTMDQEKCKPEKVKCNEEILETPPECSEKFAFPQVQYPEDNLPRVIVCGNTEENFPKIVVADSRPRSQGNKCLQNLTGKLTESLSMQEKLSKVNAELETGKSMLEKQLMEKDNALDCIQRKICGLQAEMRMIAKENFELNEKVACLQKRSPCPPPPCPPSPCPLPCPPPKPVCPPPKPACPPPKPACPPPKPACLRQSPPVKPACPPPKPACPPPKPACPPPKPACPSPKPAFPVMGYNSPRTPSPNSNKFSNQNDLCSCGNDHSNTNAIKNCNHKSSRLGGGASRSNDCCPSSHKEAQQRDGTGNNCPNSAPNRVQRPCPAEMEKNSKNLGDQLSCIENEVNELTHQMINRQQEQQQLDMQRKLAENVGPSIQFCCPKSLTPTHSPPQDPNSCAAQQLRDLREQYARLQDDYKNKLCEVSRLRCDSEVLRRETREAKEERERIEIKLVDVQERLRVTECERNELLGSKEQLIEQEQALLVARQRFREAQDELEELRSMIRDQAAQLDDYRNKYLQAQQQVEEQKHQMDLMEMDNARMNENVTLEINRVKNQFQEKLAELAPLSDILKQTQIKLQENQQLRMAVEHNCEDLSRELLGAKEKIDCMQNQINELQREIQSLQDDKSESCMLIEELEKKNGEMRNENERMKNTVCRLEEQFTCTQKRLDEKQHEIVQLNAMLEQIREDSARQVARTKERSEAVKKSLQAEISEFEIQLAMCRAAAKTAQKERDEIRQKMQGQICNLNETLQQAQGRIRSLQGHVDYLKVSYSNIFTNQGQCDNPPVLPQAEQTNTGYDACDCSY
ncbi:PREDICTED: uncharacterized protein LOC105360420 [Ceratosolen solmsi marchali]|uniref:Uncharacterized protein LOC105360420 n=1 Tax=Ceratosolen solmsi marchali TaxID=326594 RepID=A0AAJ6VM88_9HYME|nr:PREDICTED: uncharacterized protein LOC105360420 [Ceratosolen solmsi marchali]